MIIGFARTIEFGTEEYMKIASGKKDIIEFKRDGTDTFGGDMLIIREVRKNGLKGMKRNSKSSATSTTEIQISTQLTSDR